MNNTLLENDINSEELNIKNIYNLDNDFLNSPVTIEKQNTFLETTLGRAINTGINLALRALLPDLIESQIIDIKDILFKQGLKEGIKSVINSAIDLGKSTLGIFTGKFENISQVQAAVKNGGILDSTSSLIGKAIDDAKKNKLIDSTTATLLKRGKNMIIENINNNIEDLLTSQIKSIEKVSKYSKSWNTYYESRDFEGMQKEFKKLESELKNLIPLEQAIKTARYIENIHNLINNNGKNFNLSKEELELAQKLL